MSAYAVSKTALTRSTEPLAAERGVTSYPTLLAKPHTVYSGACTGLPVRRAPCRVPIAHQQPIVRHGVRALLAGEPDVEVVAETDTGAEGVRLARRLRPHVVLVDLLLPAPPAISHHSLSIIRRRRTAAAISVPPVTSAQTAMTESRTSAVMPGHATATIPAAMPAMPSTSGAQRCDS
jgi:CheY-like chemotaxis protein